MTVKYSTIKTKDIKIILRKKESNLHWERIRDLYKYFKKNTKNYKLLQLSSIQKKKKDKKFLKISSAQAPIIVKKQKKYNINRWAVCGENNFIKTLSVGKFLNPLKRKRLKKGYVD